MLTPSLSTRLRDGTRDSHRLAETTPFIRAFFKGDLSLESYRQYLAQLLHIYTALEDGQAAQRQHAVFGRVYFAQLDRRPALEEDLSLYFAGEDWREIAPLEATRIYAAHIHHLWQKDVPAMVAHHYTRYLGDLSGGQALKRIVAKMFPEVLPAGLAFYTFPQIADQQAFKEQYRAALDAIELDEAAAQHIVEEANHAFELNRRMFAGMMERMGV